MFRGSRPWFFENSKVPIFLSKVAPININAITIGPLVFSRGKISDITRRHETIHWQQYIETFIVGFLFLYFSFYVVGLIKGLRGSDAYRSIPFEKEAYTHQGDQDYLDSRKRYTWLKHIFVKG